MRSETISELAKALTSFQGQMTAVKKDAVNPFYKSKYATLDTIWETVRKPLSENGLSVAQTMNLIEDKSVLETTLYHTSGEWISGIQLVNPTKSDPQALGSAISYARRYSLSAMLGIVADEDDDANSTKEKSTTKERDTVTDGEEARDYMKSHFGKNSTKELTKDEASAMIEFLNEIKQGEGHLVRAAKEEGAKEKVA